MASPLPYLTAEVNMWKLFGLFDIETDSKSLQLLFTVYCIFFQIVYIDIGCSMQAFAVVDANGIKEAVEIFFISIAYMNAAFKFFIAYRNRKDLQMLWNSLDAPEFRTIVADEKV